MKMFFPNTMPTEKSAAYDRTFRTLADRLGRDVGHQLFTVSRLLVGGNEVERIFSTRPDLYPIQGRKPVDQSDWTAQMARGECFVASQPQDFGPHFGDLETIVANGLGAVINVPVHDGARQLGTLNLLDAAGAYRHDVVPACLAARDLAIQGFREYEQFLDHPSI